MAWTRFSARILLVIMLIFELGSPAAIAQEQTWSQRAVADLTAIHEILRDDHPGAVDVANPAFRQWLEDGFGQAMDMARSAQGRADYNRALRYYVNGFRDGHVALNMNFGTAAPTRVWPGFMAITGDDNRTLVSGSAGDSSIVRGDEIVSCDGVPTAELAERWVHRIATNAAIPHLRTPNSSSLFFPAEDDNARHFRSCIVRRGSSDREVSLTWRRISNDDVQARIAETGLFSQPAPLGIRQIQGIWFISIPSFDWPGPRRAEFNAFLSDLHSRLPVLHAAPRVIIDVRGNGGGDSGLGDAVAAELFGRQLQQVVSASLDWTVDWRVSPHDLAVQREKVVRMRADGDVENARERGALADRMARALARGEPLLRVSHPATPYRQLGGSPFHGMVYFLTDSSCGSACLDFADIIRPMPGVVHIGKPTFADSIYMELPATPVALPSGIANLYYPLKVFRHRGRGNNVWYTPQRLWPGGPMTDEAVATWVNGLN